MFKKIENSMLKSYEESNIFEYKKIAILFRMTLALAIFYLVIIIPQHISQFDKNPYLLVGTGFMELAIIYTLYLLYIGKNIKAGYIMIISPIVAVFINNVLYDFIMLPENPVVRFFETLFYIIGFQSMVLVYFTKVKQIVIFTVMSVFTLICHSYVLGGFDIYYIYIFTPILTGIFYLINILVTNKAIKGYEKSQKELKDLNEKLEEKVYKRTQELEEANEKLMTLSIIDGLTGVHNRRFFEKEYKRVWNHFREEDKSYGVAMFDIDFFKRYNDTYGHIEGDQCLVAVGNVLENCFNKNGSFVARYGGEEFVVVFQYHTQDQAKEIIEESLIKIRQLNIPNKDTEQGYITISVGLSFFQSEDQNPYLALKRADKALYKAKESGRNQLITNASCYY